MSMPKHAQKMTLNTVVFGEGFLHQPAPALALAAEVGFEAIVTSPAVLEQINAHDLRNCLLDHGLEATAFHVNTTRLSDVGYLRTLAEASQLLGMSNVITSGTYAHSNAFDMFETARHLSKMASVLQSQYGLQLNYHHQDWELLADCNGQLALEVLLAGAPELGLVIDTFWIAATNVDLRQLLSRFGTRCSVLYLRDGNPETLSSTALGAGSCLTTGIWQQILRTCIAHLTYVQTSAHSLSIKESVVESANWLHRWRPRHD